MSASSAKRGCVFSRRNIWVDVPGVQAITKGMGGCEKRRDEKRRDKNKRKGRHIMRRKILPKQFRDKRQIVVEK